jgi:cytochrome b561
MSWRNTRQVYGWAAIALHWISAGSVIWLYFLGDAVEDAPDRASKIAAMQTHVSVSMLLFAFLAARVLWSLSQPKPESLDPNRLFRILATLVQWLFMLMIVVLLITGPAVIWALGRPVQVFDWFAIPSPFPSPMHDVHEGFEFIHGAAAKLFWPLIVLHVLGALKHLVFDRDRTLQRMLWVRRTP